MSNGQSFSNGNSPGPLMLTIAGVPLNPVPMEWRGVVPDFGL